MATSTLPVTSPDTGDLASLADQINDRHEACKAAVGEAIRHANDAGTLLIEAKANCNHGKWKDWLAENFAGTARTAQRYIRIAKNWPAISGANATRMSDLSINDALEQISQATSALAKLDDESQAKALAASGDKGQPLKFAAREIVHEQERNGGDYIGRLEPLPNGGRDLIVRRFEAERKWSIERGPNEAGSRRAELFEEMEQDDLISGIREQATEKRTELAEVQKRITKLKRQADKLEKAAREDDREANQLTRELIEDVHGPMISWTDVRDYQVLDDETEQYIDSLSDEGVEAYLLANRGSDKVKEIAVGRWGDIRHHSHLAVQPPVDGEWALSDMTGCGQSPRVESQAALF